MRLELLAALPDDRMPCMFGYTPSGRFVGIYRRMRGEVPEAGWVFRAPVAVFFIGITVAADLIVYGSLENLYADYQDSTDSVYVTVGLIAAFMASTSAGIAVRALRWAPGGWAWTLGASLLASLSALPYPEMLGPAALGLNVALAVAAVGCGTRVVVTRSRHLAPTTRWP
jgi:hypothetical protein